MIYPLEPDPKQDEVRRLAEEYKALLKQVDELAGPCVWTVSTNWPPLIAKIWIRLHGLGRWPVK